MNFFKRLCCIELWLGLSRGLWYVSNICQKLISVEYYICPCPQIGEYVCKASNLWGEDQTVASKSLYTHVPQQIRIKISLSCAVIKTTGKPGIIYDSQLPEGMHSIEKIREMESAWQRTP